MKLMQDVVKTIRSMKLDYLPAKARPEGWFTSGIYKFGALISCSLSLPPSLPLCPSSVSGVQVR